MKIELESNNYELRISVSDSGNGLSKQEKNNCMNTFKSSDYFNNLNFDPYNIGYDLFTSHLLALLLGAEKSKEKGLILISEQGAGTCLSFLIQDMGYFENLRDNEEEEDLRCVETKMGEFNNNYFSENKFLKKEEFDPYSFQMSFKPKPCPKNQSCINPEPKKNFDVFIKNNSLHNNNIAEENEVKSNKYTFNEFSKNDEHTFTLTPSVNGEYDVDPVKDNLFHFEEKGRRPSNNLPIPPRHSISTRVGGGQIVDIKIGIENNISSITCSKMGSDMVWSFSSDSNILKDIAGLNVLEDKLRQIKEINKFKKCSCSDILLIDHDEMSNYSMKFLLMTLGFTAESASISSLALESVSKKLDSDCCKMFKMIFISNDLPSISGYETCKRIIKIYSDSNMLIPALIALANKINEKEQAEIKLAGFSDFICKPIMQNTIHFYIKKYLTADLVKKKIYIVQN